MKSIVAPSTSEKSQAAFFLLTKDDTLPKPNYQHDKRQRELEKKKKKEEKRQRKQTPEKPESDVNPLPETEQPS